MVPWDGCKAGQIASSPRTEDCIGCKRCETACPTDFLSVRVYLGAETTRSMGFSLLKKYRKRAIAFFQHCDRAAPLLVIAKREEATCALSFIFSIFSYKNFT